jgi:hypothetical protein
MAAFPSSTSQNRSVTGFSGYKHADQKLSTAKNPPQIAGKTYSLEYQFTPRKMDSPSCRLEYARWSPVKRALWGL